MKQTSVFAMCALLYSCAGTGAFVYAQTTSGFVRGTVLDPSGAAIPGATVEIKNPVSHYDQTAKTDAQGNFVFNNVPFNNYHATAKVSGFQSAEQDVDLRSPVPVELKFSLKLGAASSSMIVQAGSDLVETDPEIHTDVD